jgi:metal-responsive CopG/Arc/MetJ family transcriptional regulator
VPTDKQLANLRPGKGRPRTDNEQINITIPRSLLAQVDRICQQQNWKRSYVIECYLKKGLNLSEYNGYSDDDLTLIAKGAPIE